MKTLVVRSNYGDDSIALIQALRDLVCKAELTFSKVIVVYIDTGWAAQGWLTRVSEGERFARSCGFETRRLTSRRSFSELVRERQQFPSQKFQWCAGFLKGIPLMEWLDEVDSACAWTIALPKRQALYRKTIPAVIKECEYHGERDVWHPLVSVNDNERDVLIHRAGFKPLNHRSLECQPCVHSKPQEFAHLHPFDQAKLEWLEGCIQKKMKNPVLFQKTLKNNPMDSFTMGCGDPFGCGL
jgi:hypothetical protein